MYAASLHIAKFLWLATSWNINRNVNRMFIVCEAIEPTVFQCSEEFSHPN